MTTTAAHGASSWLGGVMVAVLVHAGVLLGVRVVADVPPPPLQVDTSLADMVRPPPPPPLEPPPSPPIAASKSPSVPTAKTQRTPEPRDEAPPPPSNRPPPPQAASSEPVPIITGVSIPTMKVRGVLVRQGNTDVPGFDPPDDKPTEKVHGYTGGVAGGTARQSGGRGEPGPGVGGGVRAARLTKPARLLKRYRPRYPRELRDEEIEGVIELRIEVLSSGKTGRVTLVRSAHPLLDQLALDAVKRFVWAPGEVDGEPVTSWVRHTFRFELYD